MAFNKPKEFSIDKSNETLRIADWNIRSFLGVNVSKERRRHIKDEITDAVLKLEPDVICLQEFNHSYVHDYGDNLSYFTKDYPYYHFSKDFTRDNGDYASGSIIFSKHPFIDTGRTKYPGRYGESLLYADIFNGSDTIRIFTTHLQSFKFNVKDYEGIEKIKTQQDEETIAASKSLIRKMKLAFTRRAAQARIVKTEIYNSPYPTVIAGDFNDVPNSYTYFTIKGANKDAFLQKGFGLGRTYLSIAPTLRIDYILPDRRFDVLQFDMIDQGLSDHLLLVTDLKLKK
jgi:endonuclease/exonuclease/phosphatase family metal-dependent hydrolase